MIWSDGPERARTPRQAEGWAYWKKGECERARGSQKQDGNRWVSQITRDFVGHRKSFAF